MDALVIIDVQQGMFTFPNYQPFDGEGTVTRIAGLLKRARATGTPRFFVQHDGGEGDPLAAGSPGFAFRAELAPQDGEIVTVKRHCSAFQETDLDEKLQRADIDNLIVCGMQTEFCVDTAVRAAVERGYKVTLVSDGHTTFDTKSLSAKDIVAHHNATLSPGFAKPMRAEEIEFTRPVRSVTPPDFSIEFREADDLHARKTILNGLLAFNETLLGPPDGKDIVLTLRATGTRSILGGLIAHTYWRWLFVELLFVPESLRGQGVGGKLLAMAESEARKLGATGSWLDTFNPKARAFYERRGYALFGQVPDNPPGSGRWFLSKRFDGAR